jgi:predicted porin
LLQKCNKFTNSRAKTPVFVVLPDPSWQNHNNFLTTAKSSLARGALQIWCSFRQIKLSKENYLMNKKLLAVAVAGALAAPGVALAQSTVTISGNFKVGIENLSYSNSPATRLNSSQMRMVDNSSRIIFTTIEDLGNGLAAIGSVDTRFAPDQSASGGSATSNPVGGGNTYVGLKSTSWGMLTFGRWDLHYGKGPSEMTRGAGALQASDVSLFDLVQVGAANLPIANTSRTQNVVRYDMPVFNGFTGTVAWSANPVGITEADMSATNAAGVQTRKGDGWNINPKYSNGPFEAEYSYWRAKPDAPALAAAASTQADQRGDSINAKYSFGGFKLGVGWNRSKLDNSYTGAKVAERTTWSLAGHYKTGPHSIYAHYDKAGNTSTAAVGTIADTGARMLAVAYEYSLSKRTSLAATYAKINNDAKANYNFFTSAGLGSTDAVPVLGESPRLLQFTVNHIF